MQVAATVINQALTEFKVIKVNCFQKMSSRREKIISLTFKKKPKNTNLQEISSRGLDYKNFPTIFENKNEYANSARYIQDVDTF